MNWTWGRGICNVPQYFCIRQDLGADQRTHLSLLVLLFILSLPWKAKDSSRPVQTIRLRQDCSPSSLQSKALARRHVPAPEPPQTASTALLAAPGLTSAEGRTAQPCQHSQPGEVQTPAPPHGILLATPSHQAPAQTLLTRCYPWENDAPSSLTELFLAHLHQHVPPFPGQASPNWQKWHYSWCSQQGGKTKEMFRFTMDYSTVKKK